MVALDEHPNFNARFLTFMDQDGETIVLRLADLVYLEYPIAWHDEEDEELGD